MQCCDAAKSTGASEANRGDHRRGNPGDVADPGIDEVGPFWEVVRCLEDDEQADDQNRQREQQAQPIQSQRQVQAEAWHPWNALHNDFANQHGGDKGAEQYKGCSSPNGRQPRREQAWRIAGRDEKRKCEPGKQDDQE